LSLLPAGEQDKRIQDAVRVANRHKKQKAALIAQSGLYTDQLCNGDLETRVTALQDFGGIFDI
jgi:hypothetical protein